MKFFVNFLSAFRILSAFAIIFTFMFDLYTLTLVLFLLAAISDWFDGFLARKYNVCTKLGGVMDHIGDKLLVVNTLIMLTVMIPTWVIIIPVIVMISRELYISGLREFMGTQKMEMPVPKARFSMGKVKTALQMITITAFLLMLAMMSQRSGTATANYISQVVLPQISITGLWLSLLASVLSATQYTITFIGRVKKMK